MASTPAAPWGDALVATLLEFERTPGRYPQALREPRLLYDRTHAVLQLAVGRTVEGLATLTGRQETAARRAARFFVRTALLRPDNDHYTLLGLGRKADAEQVRDHYRLMIRLTHPDFQASGEHWPADAASRINIAHDVLASPVRRADYDAALPAGAAAAMPKPAPVPVAAGAPRPRVGPVHLRKGLPGTPFSDRWHQLMSTRAKVIAALVGAAVCGAVLLVLDTSDEGSLAARERTVSEDTASYVDAVPRLPAAHGTVGAPPPAAQDKAVSATPATPATSTTSTAARTGAPARPAPATPLPGELRLTMDTRLAMAPASGPAPGVGDSVAPAPAVAAAPAPAQAAVAAAAEPAAAEPTTRLTMAQVHPALTNVVGSLYSGRGESLAQWIDRDWRALPANNAFVTQFNQWLAGNRVTQLGKVSFKSRNLGEQLVVDGVVEVHLQDGSNAVQVRDLQLRAYFQPQDGRPVLTQLAASQTR